jgi:YbdK family carboxylate-amine ligase
MGLTAAAGTHPLTVWEETRVSGAGRYRDLDDSLRVLARREPTMALHVHVGVPAPEDAVRVLNGLRRWLPVLLALSGNSPFWQGRDTGFASARTLIFQAFPRAGPPRWFSGYADYVDAVDALITSGAVPDPSFVWWDARLQPALGTVEVRVMDAQSTMREVAPLVALVQSLERVRSRSSTTGAHRQRAVATASRKLADLVAWLAGRFRAPNGFATRAGHLFDFRPDHRISAVPKSLRCVSRPAFGSCRTGPSANHGTPHPAFLVLVPRPR